MSRLFILSLNPVAWKLKETEEYYLSKPISAKINGLLYIDDMKICMQHQRRSWDE